MIGRVILALLLTLTALPGLAQSPGAPAPDVIVPGAFYVASDGNDSNPGTLAAPFLTVDRAKTAMRANHAGLTYVRGGGYTLPTIANCDRTNSCGIHFTSDDVNETISYYPPDGVNSADFTGGSTGLGTGVAECISATNDSNTTIIGLSIHNCQYACYWSSGGTVGTLFKYNICHDVYETAGGKAGSNPSWWGTYGCSNCVVAYNVFYNSASFGVVFGNVNGDISNLLIEGNYMQNACTVETDCGCPYIQDTFATATNMRVINNYMRDCGVASRSYSTVYLDDCTSNVTVSGNVISGKTGTYGVVVHGGNNNPIIGNLFDFATANAAAVGFQTSPASGCAAGSMSGNSFEHNILISVSGGGGYKRVSGSPLNSPMIADNAYHSYAGAPVSFTGRYTDVGPISEDPQLSGWTYNVAPDSPVFKSPVSFPGIVGGWGPPGFVVPQTGTPPSSPH